LKPGVYRIGNLITLVLFIVEHTTYIRLHVNNISGEFRNTTHNVNAFSERARISEVNMLLSFLAIDISVVNKSSYFILENT